MEFLSPFFELDQVDHELFQFSLPTLENLLTFDESLVPTLDNKTDSFKPNHKRKSSKLFSEMNEKGNENASSSKNKKIIHRDVERQRRQEMAGLNRTLRSLLPSEYLKGKRSLCDHINETMNYIGHLKKKIEELQKTKDEIKRPLNKLDIYVGSKCLPSNSSESELDEEITREFIQIILSIGLKSEVALSRILNFLIREGLNVISYTSTNVNERLVHTIESEVTEGQSVNPYDLQKKLKHLIA